MLGFSHTQKHRQTLTLNQTRVLGLNVLVLSQREVDAALDALGEQYLLDTVPTAHVEQSDSPTREEANEDASDESLPERPADPDYHNEAKDFLPESVQADQDAASRD